MGMRMIERGSSAREVREPAVAGAFYSAEPGRLEREVRGMLARAQTSSAQRPKALIVPHAGFVYSGPVAASAYALLRDLTPPIERVVLLGPAHRVPVSGLAAPACGVFRTPLGDVTLDDETLRRAAALPQVSVDERAHALEHSLEVQLPFLQAVLPPDFQLAPFAVGEASPEEVAEVLELAWGGPETLILVSSDLSHYYDYATARRMDAETTRAIEALEPGAVGRESACGRVPIRGLLVAARRHGLRARTLDLRSSGDTAGSRDQVVGYGAYAFVEPAGATAETPEEEKGTEEDADPSDSSSAIRDLAVRATAHAVRSGSAKAVSLAEQPRRLQEAGACFVTLRRDGELRGCVGELEVTRPLAVSIAENACRAALHDRRFRPVGVDELPELDVHVSVLGPLSPLEVHTRAELLDALHPGVDGVVLAEGGRRATFLPAVWESLPEPEEFVSALERKAGLPPGGWTPERRVFTYQVEEVV